VILNLEQWCQTQKPNWATKKKKVHRNVALFQIFYGIYLLLKGHLNENMNVKYAKIEEVFSEKN
jgi:hypothetical protein